MQRLKVKGSLLQGLLRILFNFPRWGGGESPHFWLWKSMFFFESLRKNTLSAFYVIQLSYGRCGLLPPMREDGCESPHSFSLNYLNIFKETMNDCDQKCCRRIWYNVWICRMSSLGLLQIPFSHPHTVGRRRKSTLSVVGVHIDYLR